MRRIRFNNSYFLENAIFIIVFLFANSFTSFSQETRSKHIHHPEYRESDIYVITNRQVDISDAGYIFANRVSNDPSLTFFRINSSCIHSIIVTKLDSTSFWPSKSLTLGSLKNLENSYWNIVKSLNHFSSVIRTMYCLRNSKNDLFKENKLSLFAHSLGNWYLENMVNKNLLSDSLSLLFDNVIINASAVDQKNHKKWVEQLGFQKNVYITYNKHDLADETRFIKRGEAIAD